jgi:hypothetical protein
MVDGYAICIVGPNPPSLIVSAYTEKIHQDVQLSFTITPYDGGPSDTTTYLVEDPDRETQPAA